MKRIALTAVLALFLSACGTTASIGPMQARTAACNAFYAYASTVDPMSLSPAARKNGAVLVESVNGMCQGPVPANVSDVLLKLSDDLIQLQTIYAPAAPASAASN